MVFLRYDRPPITEAVIEIRFDEATPETELAKASADYQELYVQNQKVRNVNAALGMRPQENTTELGVQLDVLNGWRHLSIDATQILLLWPSAFVVAQQAPYTGWEEFFGRFVRDWGIWKKTIGYKKISRIGVRYINRIDIPSEEETLEYEQYLNVYPHLPEILGNVSAYGIQTQTFFPDIGCILTVNSSSIPPNTAPLLNHVSFVLDQDIAIEKTPPQKDQDMYDLLNQIRVKKNMVFEACVSDKARGLFKNG